MSNPKQLKPTPPHPIKIGIWGVQAFASLRNQTSVPFLNFEGYETRI